jgi:hypothetical protein
MSLILIVNSRTISLFLLALLRAFVLSGCASLPTDVQRKTSSHADRDAEPSRIAARVAPYLRKHPGESGSGKLNTELGILFESEPLAKGLADWFDDNKARVA